MNADECNGVIDGLLIAKVMVTQSYKDGIPQVEQYGDQLLTFLNNEINKFEENGRNLRHTLKENWDRLWLGMLVANFFASIFLAMSLSRFYHFNFFYLIMFTYSIAYITALSLNAITTYCIFKMRE